MAPAGNIMLLHWIPFPKGVAFLCPLSLSIPVSHWHHGRNIYSGPVLLHRATKMILGINVWLWVSSQGESSRKPPTQSIQTKVRTPLPLPNYTLWLWNSDMYDMHPRTWPVHAALLMVVPVCALEMYSCQGGTAFRPWQIMKKSECNCIKWVSSSIKYENNMDEFLFVKKMCENMF